MSETRTQALPRLEEVVDHAWAAYRAADWLESHARWERVRALYPDYAPPYIHGGVSLREAGLLDEALDKLGCGLERFPDNAQLVTAFGACLDRMDRVEQMNGWFESQAQRFPNNPEIVIDHLRILQRRLDHTRMLRVAAIMERIHPQRLAADLGVRNMIADARLQIELHRIDQHPKARAKISERPVLDTSGDAGLMRRFQGLGQNCEFGLVQRHFGAEPIGLLRWAAISVEKLTLALEKGFKGVGGVEETRVTVGNGEYATEHRRYGMGSHTSIKVGHAKAAAIQDKLLMRLAYLRRELIADLEDGALTFVHTSENGATDTQIRTLHRALLQYGSRFLLFVRKSDARNPPGSVRDDGGGVMLGYVDRLGPDRRAEGDFWDICFDQWLTVLRAAVRLRARAEVGCAGAASDRSMA